MERILKWTACVCAFVTLVCAVFFVLKKNKDAYAMNKITVYDTIELTEDEYEVDLSAYETENRIIKREPNKTGVTIIYDDNTWTYIDEYTNVGENGINLGIIDIAFKKASMIKGLYIAPGYEAILMDSEAEKERNGQEGYTYIVNGEEQATSCHTTRILGPINMQGKSLMEYMMGDKAYASEEKSEVLNSWDAKLKDGKISFSKSFLGGAFGNEINSAYVSLEADNLIPKLLEGKEDEIKECIYNRISNLTDTKERVSEDGLSQCLENQDDKFVEWAKEASVKVLKKVYQDYIKGAGTVQLDDAKTFVNIADYHGNKYSSRVSNKIKLEDDSEDERQDVKLCDLRKIQVKKVSQKEGVYLMKGLYNVLSEEYRYSKRDGDEELEGVFEYVSPAIGDTVDENDFKKDRNELRTNGHVNGIMVVGDYTVKIERENAKSFLWNYTSKTEHVIIQGAKNKIICITDFWGDDKDNTDYQNEISNIQVMPTQHEGENAEKKTTDEIWSDAYYYVDQDGKTIKTKNDIKNYQNFVKVYDMAKKNGEPSVTAYTRENFKGRYLQFYSGELNNIGDDREIESIGSLEVGPNSRIIFFNREDYGIHPDKLNYGSITKFEYQKDENGNEDIQDAIIIDGPAYIPDLSDYFNRAYLEDEQLKYKRFDMKSFMVQYTKNTYEGVSLFNYINGIGTFQTEGVEHLDEKLEIKDYMPESITIRGNYFAKLYDSSGNILKTIIGPVNNYNIQPEVSEIKGMYTKSREDEGQATISIIGQEEQNEILTRFSLEIDRINTSYSMRYLGYLYNKDMNKEYILKVKQDIQDDWEGIFENKYNIGDKMIALLDEYMDKIENIMEVGYESGKKELKDYGITGGYYGVFIDETSEIGGLAKEYNEKAKAIYNGIGDETKEALINAYKKWTGSKILIGSLTGRDNKSRSLKNVDGIVLYQDINYNSGAQSAEDVWTHFSKDEILKIGNIDLTNGITKNGKCVEVEADNIHSIRLVGSLAGNYEMTISAKRKGDTSGITLEKTTRYNISDINSFFGEAESTTIQLQKITLKQVEDKEFEMQLDTSKKSGEFVLVNNFEKIDTIENIQNKKDGRTTYGLDNSQVKQIKRQVYIASLEDIIKQIEQKISTNSTAKEFARLDYVYKYDPQDFTKEDLVGVKVTRNIGRVDKAMVKLDGKNINEIETYTDIIQQEQKDISREVEFKLNLLSATDVLKDKEIILSDEFSYTDEAREFIITDHGYLDKVAGVAPNLFEQQIEMIDSNKYNIEKTDEGEILTKILKNGSEYLDPIVKLSISCQDKSGSANAKVEIVNSIYKDTKNKKEYRFELAKNTDITLEGKKVSLNKNTDETQEGKSVTGDFTLLKDGGEIVAKVLLNVSSRDEGKTKWKNLGNNLEYTIRAYLQQTNSISQVTLVENSVVSRVYKDKMEVPAMLVKEVGGNIEYATEKDKDRILYVPVCYKEGDSYKTSFLLEQLGMKANIVGNEKQGYGIEIYY